MPRLIARSPGTRTSRVDTRQRQLESLAAEFAMLAQRRARLTHQIELLEQQRTAAAGTFCKLQSRMGWLAQRIAALDPVLYDNAPEIVAPQPDPPPARKPSPLPYLSRAIAESAPAGRSHGLSLHSLNPHAAPRKWRG